MDHEKLMEKRAGETSRQLRERVLAARRIQEGRYAGHATPVNAAMTSRDVEAHCRLDGESESLLRSALVEYGLSARAYGRILKVARTIADLDGARDIAMEHLLEAVQYRRADNKN